MPKTKQKQRQTNHTKPTKAKKPRRVHKKQEMYPPNALIGKTLQQTFGRVSVAARIMGCDRILIYDRMKKHPELLHICREARRFVVPFTETKLFQNVAKNDQRAIEFVLKNRGKGWTKDDAEDKVGDLGVVIAMFQKALEETKPPTLPAHGTIIDVGLHADPKPQTD